MNNFRRRQSGATLVSSITHVEDAYIYEVSGNTQSFILGKQSHSTASLSIKVKYSEHDRIEQTYSDGSKKYIYSNVNNYTYLDEAFMYDHWIIISSLETNGNIALGDPEDINYIGILVPEEGGTITKNCIVMWSWEKPEYSFAYHYCSVTILDIGDNYQVTITPQS